MVDEFKLYLLTEEFHEICDWQKYKMTTGNKGEKRPTLLLLMDSLNEDYPDSWCCIPISKDDDKDEKYLKLSTSKPDLVHRLNKFNRYDNYLLIQNMFYVRKEFIGLPFTVNDVHVEIKKERRDIERKIKKVDSLIKRGVLKYINREEVYKIQVQYLAAKKSKTK